MEALSAQGADERLGAIVPGSVHFVLVTGLYQLGAHIAAEGSDIRLQELCQLGVQKGNTDCVTSFREYLTLLCREVLPQVEQCLLQLLRGVARGKSGVNLLQHLAQGLTSIRVRPVVGMIHIPQSRVVAVDLHELQLILGGGERNGAGIDELGLLIGLHHAHLLVDLVKDLLLQDGLQELHLVVAPQLGQVQALVLDDHPQFLAVAGPQLLDLLVALLAA